MSKPVILILILVVAALLVFRPIPPLYEPGEREYLIHQQQCYDLVRVELGEAVREGRIKPGEIDVEWMDFWVGGMSCRKP